jgi:xanthosine utilization system XapX-like protein
MFAFEFKVEEALTKVAPLLINFVFTIMNFRVISPSAIASFGLTIPL